MHLVRNEWMPMSTSPISRAWPGQVVSSSTPVDDEVGAQASYVVAEGRHRAVCGDEQVEDVEACGADVSGQARSLAGTLDDESGRFVADPGITADERRARWPS